MTTFKSESPLERYRQELLKPDVLADASQQQAVEALNVLWRELCELDHRRDSSLLARVRAWAKSEAEVGPKGLYFWGGVGRGKTWLMDMFYDALPFDRKMRTHFHRFMRRVHQELKQLNNVKDPLDKVGELIANEAQVICFDEFFVSDITDAMILANLLDALFKRGVILVATSNVEPQNLYRDGLQRVRFLPAIALLQSHCETHNLDGGVDYRLRTLEQAALYYSPLGESAHQSLGEFFEKLVPDANAIRANVPLAIEGRALFAYREAEDVAWFDFKALCDGPRSQNDYIELAREYHAVLLENVPSFVGSNDDQARRFVNLVDEFYDRGVKLIISAESEIQSLYVSGNLSFEFERTVSRILEMQSTDYLACEHKA